MSGEVIWAVFLDPAGVVIMPRYSRGIDLQAVRVLFMNKAMKREPTYFTGEPIRKGDLVRLGAWDGVLESVLTRDSPEWVDYIGEGVMLTGPAFGRLHTRFNDEDLVLVRRKEE